VENKRIKLTAGGQAYVSKFKRYKCPITDKLYLVHPNRLPIILAKNAENLSINEVVRVLQSIEDPEVKDIISRLILERYESSQIN